VNDAAQASTWAVIIAGLPGTGKSTVARELAERTGFALVDKDSITRPFVEKLMELLAGDPHDRESSLHRQEVKPLEYAAWQAVMFDNLRVRNSTIVVTPLVGERRDPRWLRDFERDVRAAGAEIALVWVDCETRTMRRRLLERAAPRDAWKLAHWEEHLTRNEPSARPIVPHLRIDTEPAAQPDVDEQIDRLAATLLKGSGKASAAASSDPCIG
jgi:predicted kinase